MASTPPPKPGIDTFHKERSKCIDAFVSAEIAVIRLLILTSTKFGGESFGAKVELLKKAKVSPKYTEARKQKVNKILSEATKLFEVRNDLVHAKLQFAIIGDDQRACFTNAKECLAGMQSARLFTLEGMRTMSGQASALADELGAA